MHRHLCIFIALYAHDFNKVGIVALSGVYEGLPQVEVDREAEGDEGLVHIVGANICDFGLVDKALTVDFFTVYTVENLLTVEVFLQGEADELLSAQF